MNCIYYPLTTFMVEILCFLNDRLFIYSECVRFFAIKSFFLDCFSQKNQIEIMVFK